MGVRISLPVQKKKEAKVKVERKSALSLASGLIQTLFFMNKISNYFRDSYKELGEKVTWPNWLQLQQSTMIVLISTLLITALVALMDLISASGLKFIYKIF